MATLRTSVRRSYDNFRAESDDAAGSTYVCDCGQEYMDEVTLHRHQQDNCKNRLVTCSFCQETCASSAELRQHLLLCGNKTDQCPNCRQLIRRSHFAYHYENNCAAIDEVETPPMRPKSRSNQRLPTNSNKPVSREDVPSDDYFVQNSSMYPPTTNGRTQSSSSNPRNSPRIIECEHCHNQCAQNDYITHRDNCLYNPANNNLRPPPRIPLRPNQSQNQNVSNGIVHIPCEFCNEPVDVPNWSKHTQNCREQEAKRLAGRARSISQEPILEQIPCEYCQQLYPAKQLHSHEASCSKNPNNIASAGRLARSRPGSSVTLPTKPKVRRDVHYQSIDIDETHAANRLSGNARSINNKNRNPGPIRRVASDEVLLHPQDDQNEHRSNDNISQPRRHGSSHGSLQRTRSSFDNLRNIENNQDPRSTTTDNRSPYNNNPKRQVRRGPGGERYEEINNQPNTRTIKKHKQPWWKELFGCAGTGGSES